MWTVYFRFIKLRRGKVITHSHGEIDFSRDDIPVEICKELFDNGFPYLELTESGIQKYFPVVPEIMENNIPIFDNRKISNPMKRGSQKNK